MAKAKRIAYENMTPAQKERAQQWADRWGRRPEDCPMLANGLIVTNKPKNLTAQQSEDYDIVSKGYAERMGDITDEIREQYRKEMAEFAADYRPIDLKRGGR